MKNFDLGLIYKATCVITGKPYVGKSMRTKTRRWAEHVACAIAGASGELYVAMRTYGIDAFKVRQIRRCTEPVLNAMEIYYIAKYDSFRNGYNMTPGGDGVRMTPAMRKKIGRGLTKFHAEHPEAGLAHSLKMTGHKQSMRTIKRRNHSLTGQLRDDVICELMSMSASNKPPMSEEHRKNLGKACRARFAKPGMREKRSEEQRLKWQDDVYRAQMVAAHSHPMPPWTPSRRAKFVATQARKRAAREGKL
jgi:hypothetical protein